MKNSNKTDTTAITGIEPVIIGSKPTAFPLGYIAMLELLQPFIIKIIKTKYYTDNNHNPYNPKQYI